MILEDTDVYVAEMEMGQWVMGHGSCGSWVNCVMGHMGHGSRKMAHFHLMVRDRQIESRKLIPKTKRCVSKRTISNFLDIFLGNRS